MKAPHIRTNGFTLVELVAAIAIIGILVGIVAISAGHSRETTIATRAQADIEALNAAKGLWSLDHNGGGATFNALSESEKFTALSPYLSAERPYASLQEFQAPGCSYHINNLGVPAQNGP